MHNIIDIHDHILFDVDDGAKNLNESLEMLERAYVGGCHTIILTPHFHLGRNYINNKKVKTNFDILKSEAAKKFPDLDLYLGNEIYYSFDIPDILESGEIFTLANSNYILVEYSETAEIDLIKNSIMEIKQIGYFPIIAHVERIEAVYDVKQVYDLISIGAYIQVNAGSVLRKNPKVKNMLKNKLVHFIGSDAHNLKNRSFNLDSCFDIVSKKYGKVYANRIFYKNALRVLKNLTL